MHVVGRNASRTEPARFIVMLLKSKGAHVVTPETNDARHRADEANVRRTAKLLAVFVVDTNETELTNPIRELRPNTVR